MWVIVCEELAGSWPINEVSRCSTRDGSQETYIMFIIDQITTTFKPKARLSPGKPKQGYQWPKNGTCVNFFLMKHFVLVVIFAIVSVGIFGGNYDDETAFTGYGLEWAFYLCKSCVNVLRLWSGPSTCVSHV